MFTMTLTFVICHFFFPSLATLYNWRYKSLGSLPHVENRPEFLHANAGFKYEYQLIDVGDFNGMGESEPNPYFYQVSLEKYEWNRFKLG